MIILVQTFLGFFKEFRYYISLIQRFTALFVKYKTGDWAKGNRMYIIIRAIRILHTLGLLYLNLEPSNLVQGHCMHIIYKRHTLGELLSTFDQEERNMLWKLVVIDGWTDGWTDKYLCYHRSGPLKTVDKIQVLSKMLCPPFNSAKCMILMIIICLSHIVFIHRMDREAVCVLGHLLWYVHSSYVMERS